MRLMQLRGVHLRQCPMSNLPRLGRTLLALAFGVLVTSIPIARVAACSCGMVETAEAIRSAQLAFVGTVTGQRDTGRQSEFGDRMHEYAFAVERSTLPTDEVAVIVAGSGGSTCGMTFANGEEWLVLSRRTAEGMETNLCSGNVLMSEIAEDERAAILEMLPSQPSASPGTAEAPSEPSAAPDEAAERSEADTLIILAGTGGLAILFAGAAALLVLRRRGVS